MALLDDLPLATVAFIAIVLAGFYALVTGEITFLEFGAAVGAGGVGTAGVGKVRNDANKGTRVRYKRKRG
jgi:curli biogenesis system outer membrane secretion channel CsgG